MKNNIINNKSSNPGEVWRNISKLTGKRSKATDISNINYNGSFIKNEETIVDAFNKYSYFSEIGKSLSVKIETSDLNCTNFLKHTELRNYI